GGQAGLGRGCGRRLGGWHSGKGRGTERGGHGRAWSPRCVLSEEQLRKKKVRRQQQKGAGGEAPLPQVPPLPPTPLAEPARLSPQQELMIRQLVAAQQQCNKRSFSDQPKVTIMLLETARRYNHETESITFLKDFTYSKDDFHRAGARAGGGGGCGGDRLMFPRMLMKLVALRTLSSVHSEQVFALRLQDKKLPPLLSEIWDVHE
uniref:Nuclear receptor subfamily 1 group H member 2 n=1 Tax=Chrysemys picta bellii TaxID=8478 RepID=A0A8C3HBS6_CHRPI